MREEVIYQLIDKALLEMNLTYEPQRRVHRSPDFPYFVRIELDVVDNYILMDFYQETRRGSLMSVGDSHYHYGVTENIIEDIKNWLRKREYPVDRILRTKRLRALLS